MSRAFVKDQDDVVDEAPERPVSPHPNLVTERGLGLIDAEIERLRKELAHAMQTADRQAIAILSRDLRYWTQRRTTAQLIETAYVAPVARAMLGRAVGDEITLPGGTAEIEKIE